MPQITLDVVSLDASPLSLPRSCLFDSNGGTIGRDEGNTLVLPDKHRRVSRLHAAVSFPDGVPTLTNASTSLPLCVGDVPLDCGQTIQLSSGWRSAPISCGCSPSPLVNLQHRKQSGPKQPVRQDFRRWSRMPR